MFFRLRIQLFSMEIGKTIILTLQPIFGHSKKKNYSRYVFSDFVTYHIPGDWYS